MLQIVMALMMLLAGAGAWRAWRRSPVYSTKKTLEAAGAFLLAVAFIVVMTEWIVGEKPAGQSPVAGTILMIIVSMAAAAGAIVVVLRITDDYFVRLPVSVARVHFHRRKALGWVKRAGIGLVVIVVPFLFFPFWRILGAILGGFYLFVALIVLLSLYAKAGRYDRGMAALLANPWVHWEYTPEQWQAWADAQAALGRVSVRRFKPKRDLLPLLAVPLTFVVIGFIERGDPEMPMIMLISIATLVLVMAGLVWSVRTAAERKRRGLLAGSRHVYLGADGLLCGDEYTPWLLSGNYLVAATVKRDPPERLVLGFEVFSGRSSLRVDRFVPLPAGSERDLEVLQQQLRSECPKAAIKILERTV